MFLKSNDISNNFVWDREKKAFMKNPNKIQFLEKLQIYHLNLNKLGENARLSA